LQGDKGNLENFIIDLKEKKPKISYIENLLVNESKEHVQFSDLKIEKSVEGRGISLTLPPDIAICNDCLKDMRNPSLKKYYNYPFIACAICGPRYTTVKYLPYDRERTTMNIFPFCTSAEPESCIKEYSDFNNRRFHAQTFACNTCGPNYELYDHSGILIQTDSIEEILQKSAEFIIQDHILAVKGIGGVHLVCLAESDEPIRKLRTRKGKRKNKPFALMVPQIELIEGSFNISQKERELITSYRRPIVLLERKTEGKKIISDLVAPGLNNIGFMLPYSGIHHLLFDHLSQQPLVYTSGNKSHIPMAIENAAIFEQLKDLADAYLLHNRPIYQRVDDSVLRVHNEKIKLIRRSRGYVPEYISLPFEVKVPAALAMGPLLSTTGAVLRQNRIFPTQHIGNLTHLETYEFLKNALSHLKELLKILDEEIKFISCDLHPTFMTTRLGKELSEQYGVPLYPIQHHFAHILSLMAENEIKIDEKVIGISTDGVGYGTDGHIWGGEILICSYESFKRPVHLEYQPMIGGDRCTKYPARMFASILLNTLGAEEASQFFEKMRIQDDLEYGKTELNTIINQYQISNGKFEEHQIPLTSSTGRIFDTIAYLLSLCNLKTYRGEPAMRLEGLAMKGNPNKIDLKIDLKNTSKLILDILHLLDDSKNKKEDIAASFQIEMGQCLAKLAIKHAKIQNIKKIGLSGGVAYNSSFSNIIKQVVSRKGYEFLEHDIIPPGDAGISTGQLVGGLFKFLT
jgi:hydrogenase maturation protein HypF